MSYDNIPDVPETPDLPTQIAFPLKAIVRTVVQNLVGLLLAWLARNGVEFADPNVAMYLVDIITAVIWVLGTALATWVMTRQTINDALTRFGLGARPKDAV